MSEISGRILTHADWLTDAGKGVRAKIDGAKPVSSARAVESWLESARKKERKKVPSPASQVAAKPHSATSLLYLIAPWRFFFFSKNREMPDNGVIRRTHSMWTISIIQGKIHLIVEIFICAKTRIEIDLRFRRKKLPRLPPLFRKNRHPPRTKKLAQKNIFFHLASSRKLYQAASSV